MFTVETIVASAIGLLFLGDRARPHFAAVLGFLATVYSSIALAR